LLETSSDAVDCYSTSEASIPDAVSRFRALTREVSGLHHLNDHGMEGMIPIIPSFLRTSVAIINIMQDLRDFGLMKIQSFMSGKE
jgi:hypothetical protein